MDWTTQERRKKRTSKKNVDGRSTSSHDNKTLWIGYHGTEGKRGHPRKTWMEGVQVAMTTRHYGLDTMGQKEKEDIQEKHGWKEYKQP